MKRGLFSSIEITTQGSPIFVSDATATFNRMGPDGVLRTAEEMQAITLTNLHQEFATIVTTDEVLMDSQPTYWGHQD